MLSVVGIDVSNNNRVTDWHAVAKAGIRFVWCKASQGETFADQTYLAYRDGARAAGLLVGAYHMLTPGSIPAQLGLFLDHTNHLEHCGLPPLADVELPGLTVAGVTAFMGGLPRGAVIYFGRPARDQLGRLPAQWRNWNLMIPAYQPDPPQVPAPWQRMVAWQHTSTGRVPGIAGDVDMTYADAAWFASLHPLGAQMQAMGYATSSAGREEGFLVSSAGQILHNYQDANHNWVGWAAFTDPGSLGQTVIGLCVGVNRVGALHVGAMAADGSVHHCWQTTPGGAWSTWAAW
jgi:lysozyme